METKDYLKKIRIEKGISARELSSIFNLEESAISEIERGKRKLTTNMLKKYCEYFQESADIILNLSNKIPNIIYEDNNLIFFDYKIKNDLRNNEQYCSLKIKFKEKKWSNIFIKYNYNFNYYNNSIGTYIPGEKKSSFFTSLSDYKENEIIEIILLDYKMDSEYNFLLYPLKNKILTIISVEEKLG